MNTDRIDNNDITHGAARRVLMDGNPDNEPQLANEHEHVPAGHMCECVRSICQAAQNPGKKNVTKQVLRFQTNSRSLTRRVF